MRKAKWAIWVGVAGLLLSGGCGKPSVTPAEEADYGSLRDQVVNRVKTGQIQLGPSGVADLGPEFAMTSSSGKIFAAKTPVSGWVVAFPLQEGRVGIRCLLSIEKTAPPSGQPLQVGGLNFIVGSRSQGNWYQGVLASE